MALHSSGPWEIRRTGNRAQDISIFMEGAAPSSGCICKIPYRDGRQTTVEANAKLIAAAPDLYKVLTDLIATIDLHTDCMSGQIDGAALDKYIEAAEEILTSVEPFSC